MLVHHPVPARRPAQTARHALGFTAIELLIVITILAVLTAMAVPSFGPMIERWRTNQAVNNITSTIYVARSEAIKRGGRVSVRKMANGTDGCSFASTNQEWSCGWIIFVDADENGNLDAGEEILQSFQMPTSVNVMNNNSAASFRFDRWGRTNNINAASFAIVPRAGGVASPAATAVCFSSGGRVRVDKGSVTC
ncbi:GspH/FimT family pseudopilin [Acidovorax sp.]|uniref:GspH/FimT family pseudopilin n=1 Tax=Acidovorax sp. TaxID=1872122 RepID=UPI0025BE6899|nr:GspH/FimT family pseudopilin [Acidovorax sp.]MBW8461452.1 GspH/FimT family pseudopilin [Acidovorax sp.]